MRVALRMRRRRNDLRMELGKAYVKLGRTVEAEQKFRQVLALSPDDADALARVAVDGQGRTEYSELSAISPRRTRFDCAHHGLRARSSEN